MATTPPPAVAEALAFLGEAITCACPYPFRGAEHVCANHRALALIRDHLHAGAGPGGERAALVRYVRDLRKRVTASEALRPYISHRTSCAWIQSENSFGEPRSACSCGLAALLPTPAPATEAT